MTEYFAGLDIGSTMTKVVIMNGGVISSVVGPTGPEQRRLANKVMEEALKKIGLPFASITYVVATGYGRINVPFADRQITEIACHARGVASIFPEARTIIDIGGQDSKGIRVDGGRPVDFVMNDKCAAGSGRFLEVIADTLGVKIEDLGEISLTSTKPASISNICTIWAEQEVVEMLAGGAPLNDLVAGVHASLADRISRMIRRLDVVGEVVMTGGGAKNIGLVKAFSDKLGCPILIPPEPLITGAVGAALLGMDLVEKAKKEDEILAKKERYLEEIAILQ
jgi:predicted CoA-substrate-specific enzyme activase